MTNILKKIVQDKKETLNLIKKNNSLDSIEKKIALAVFVALAADFCYSLCAEQTGAIGW